MLFQISRTRSEYLNKTFSNLRRGIKANSSECPLNHKEIGLVAENDHLVGHCLCSLCTCTKHICPGSYFHEPYPKCIYKSQYKTNFSQKVLKPVAKFKHMSNFLPMQPVDLETTNHHFYKPPKSLSRPESTCSRPERPASTAPKVNFELSSTYASSYKGWSVDPFPIMKQVHINHLKKDCRLDGKTVYSNSFLNRKNKNIKNPSPYYNPNIKMSTTSQIGFSYPKETTQRKEFKDYSRVVKRPRVFLCKERMPRLTPTASQYITTNKQDYRKHDILIDPKVAVKVLKKQKIIR